MNEKVSPFDQSRILSAILSQIDEGKLELARELKRDLLKFLKDKKMEFEWLENFEIKSEGTQG